jgi:hypothetical protein
MVLDPSLTAIVFAFGVIAWVLVMERPQKSELRLEPPIP